MSPSHKDYFDSLWIMSSIMNSERTGYKVQRLIINLHSKCWNAFLIFSHTKYDSNNACRNTISGFKYFHCLEKYDNTAIILKVPLLTSFRKRTYVSLTSMHTIPVSISNSPYYSLRNCTQAIHITICKQPFGANFSNVHIRRVKLPNIHIDTHWVGFQPQLVLCNSRNKKQLLPKIERKIQPEPFEFREIHHCAIS